MSEAAHKTMIGAMFLSGVAMSANPLADAPTIKAGEFWTYRSTTEKGPSRSTTP